MNILKIDRRIFTVSAFMGCFFALCRVLAKLDTLLALPGGIFRLAAEFCIFALLCCALLCVLYLVARNLSLTLPVERDRKTNKRRLAFVFFAVFFILMSWFCMWMMFRFPGCMSPDSLWQVMQAQGEMPLSNHHPVVHTLIIRACLELGYAISGNPSVALALYTLLQSSMLAACYSYLIMTMYKLRVKMWAILLVLASLIVLPYHGSLSVTMVKDVWFAGFILVLCTTLWRLIVTFSAGCKVSLWEIAMLFVSSLGMCIFRTNGLYAFFAVLPFLVAFFFKKGPAAAIAPVLALTAALLITGPVYRSMGIVPPDTIESLSVPAQHIARAITDGVELNEEQAELLGHVMDLDAVAETYCSWLSDPIKELVRNTGDQEYLAEHKRDFLRLWLELGLENPGSYLRAQIDLTCGYWYPKTDGTVMYLYFTDTETTEGYCLLPAPVAAVLSAMARFMPSIPVLNLFFSNGAAVWLYLTLFGLCLTKRRRSELILFIPVLAVWATLLIATPLDNEFRYAYSVFATLPLMCVVPFTHVNNHNTAVEAR